MSTHKHTPKQNKQKKKPVTRGDKFILSTIFI